MLSSFARTIIYAIGVCLYKFTLVYVPTPCSLSDVLCLILFLTLFSAILFFEPPKTELLGVRKLRVGLSVRFIFLTIRLSIFNKLSNSSLQFRQNVHLLNKNWNGRQQAYRKHSWDRR